MYMRGLGLGNDRWCLYVIMDIECVEIDLKLG